MSDTLLTHYQSIEHTSEQMLQAARRQDWAEVGRLEAVCTEQIAHVQEHSKRVKLSPTAQAKKQRIMLAILRHDAQVRSLAEPWMADLSRLLDPRHTGLWH
ncbi:MAG TPA: flagellar protein FliT [Macromonas sp.]|nr:flagellar protein FliT [Macromonas sp.]